MKKKFVKITMITIIIVLILLLFPYVRILFRCKPSRLICVGQINIDNNARPLCFERGFDKINREDIESELSWLSELESGYVILNQQEMADLIKVINQYDDYPTVIMSQVKSRVFWTRYRTPHVGYMNIHQIRSDGKLTYDDVIYVYVTKCTEIDDKPEEWLY